MLLFLGVCNFISTSASGVNKTKIETMKDLKELCRASYGDLNVAVDIKIKSSYSWRGNEGQIAHWRPFLVKNIRASAKGHYVLTGEINEGSPETVVIRYCPHASRYMKEKVFKEELRDCGCAPIVYSYKKGGKITKPEKSYLKDSKS